MRFKKAMKKLVCMAVAVFVAAMGMSVSADNGSSRDYAGYGAVIYSDIGAYVNHYPIASYSCIGKTVVVAEDLRNYGFDVDWNGDARTLNILPNYTKEISGCGTVYSGAGRQGNVFTYTCDSDIKVYIGDIEIPAYCIDGYMMVSIEDLADLSEGIEFTWDSSTRSAKLWISWCAITVWQPLPVDVTVNNYPSDSEPTYSAGISEVGPYQGIFKKGDKYVAISLYTGVAPGESEIGVVAHIIKPELVNIDGYFIPQFELIGDQGSVYDEGNNTYSIVMNNIKYGIIFKNGGIVLNSYTGEGSDFNGEYLQVSNNGANMMPKDIWYNESDTGSINTVDTLPNGWNYPTAEIGYEYCCMGRVVGKGTLKEFSAGNINYDELVSLSEEYNSKNRIQTDNGLTPQKALDEIRSAYGESVTGSIVIYHDFVQVNKSFDTQAEYQDNYFRVVYCPNGSIWATLKDIPCYEVYAGFDEYFNDTNSGGKVLDLNNNIIGEAN